jgi:outer membrane biogenesis lipoprotein LolB
MASSRPVVRGRLPLLPLVLSVLAAAACAARAPRLVPPAGEVSAVEGYGSASISGPEASIKGKFAFVFRSPDLGRVEALDPLGRTVFLVLFRGGRAWFALPGRKVYCEDAAAVMMERFLGLTLEPDEILRLLSGTWRAAAAPGEGNGWRVTRDASGRIVRGARDGYGFTVRTFFPGDGVPREIGLAGPGTAGRVKVLKLKFDPPPREGTFDTAFLRAYAPKTWNEIAELVER